MDDLEKTPQAKQIIPTTSVARLITPLNEAEQAVRVASDNLVAVLGVEVFRILDGFLGVENYSGYEFEPQDHWATFVQLNNDAALRYIKELSLGNGYGYVLTATSEKEFRELRPPA